MEAPAGLSEKLRDLIDLIDKLRDVGVNEVIKLPRIAVVGSQSAGKSSVLDAIVGFDILPKGDGVVTRCPLELRLHRLPRGSDQSAYAVIVGADGTERRIDDLKQVQQAIVDLTNEIAGTNQRIVDKAIVLSIFTHNCPDLTVVDLPGITRVPLKGSDHTVDVEQITKQMALNYIKNDRVIILAVVPANQDATTTDALQLAKLVDPDMKRTIGVVTKVDLMDKGTDAKELILGNVVEMKLGFVAVKNRSKDEVVGGKTVREAIADEDVFFRDHPIYSHLKPSLLGTQALIDKLSEEYRLHAKDLLPKLKTEITTKKDATDRELASLGAEVPTDIDDIRRMAIEMTQAYLEQIENIFDTKDLSELPAELTQVSSNALANRARFRQICQTCLSVLDVEKAMTALTPQKIEQALNLLDGDGLRGFRDPRIFKFLIKPLLKLVESPARDCVANVADLLESLCAISAQTAGVMRFPEFRDCLVNIANDTVDLLKKESSSVIADYCAGTTEYIYENASPSLPPIFTSRQSTCDEDEEDNQSAEAIRAHQINEIRTFLQEYLTLVFAETKNVVPRLVGKFMINAFMKRIKTNLYRVAASNTLSELVQETQDTRIHRELLKTRKQALDKANTLLRKYLG